MRAEKTEVDALGAEALPGGLAEILRTLQTELVPVLPVPRVPGKRGVRAFFARRRKPQEVTT